MRVVARSNSFIPSKCKTQRIARGGFAVGFVLHCRCGWVLSFVTAFYGNRGTKFLRSERERSKPRGRFTCERLKKLRPGHIGACRGAIESFGFKKLNVRVRFFPVRGTRSAFHPHAQRSAFHRRDVRLQSRSCTPFGITVLNVRL